MIGKGPYQHQRHHQHQKPARDGQTRDRLLAVVSNLSLDKRLRGFLHAVCVGRRAGRRGHSLPLHGRRVDPSVIFRLRTILFLADRTITTTPITHGLVRGIQQVTSPAPLLLQQQISQLFKLVVRNRRGRINVDPTQAPPKLPRRLRGGRASPTTRASPARRVVVLPGPSLCRGRRHGRRPGEQGEREPGGAGTSGGGGERGSLTSFSTVRRESNGERLELSALRANTERARFSRLFTRRKKARGARPGSPFTLSASRARSGEKDGTCTAPC